MERASAARQWLAVCRALCSGAGSCGAASALIPTRVPAVPSPWQERPVEVGDWRKNVEAMSGMEGRKKMFDAAKSPTGQ